MKIFFLFSLAILFLNPINYAQYSDAKTLEKRMDALKSKSKLVTISSLAKTSGGKDISLVTLGKGDIHNKPGIAVIGGISGPAVYSTELVIQVLEKMVARNPDILEEASFYFIPNVTPDASDQFFSSLKYEREGNARPYDDDRDGKTDEDGCDDLNNDGLITWMRIKDPAKGEWMVHPDNPSVMVKADRTKNEKGEYLVYAEGKDNDKDGRINEDLPGGIIFNKNWSYNYKYFEEGAGENAISEAETYALARFLFDQWNIYAVLCVGPENNLSEYCDLKIKLVDDKVPAVIPQADKPYFESVVNLYKDRVKLNNPGMVAPAGGDLLSWIYFHYTRFAFSTPGWNVSADKNNRGSHDYDYLLWADKQGLKDQTLTWQKVDHPDYPGKEVEAGGIKPFVSINPPSSALDTVSNSHLDFLLKLAAMHPALSFNEVKVTKNSGDIYMIEAEITNTGGLPTMTNYAVQSRWVKKIRVELIASGKQEITGGRKVFLLTRINPGETEKISWLVSGNGMMTLKAGSPQTGYISKNVELR